MLAHFDSLAAACCAVSYLFWQQAVPEAKRTHSEFNYSQAPLLD